MDVQDLRTKRKGETVSPTRRLRENPSEAAIGSDQKPPRQLGLPAFAGVEESKRIIRRRSKRPGVETRPTRCRPLGAIHSNTALPLPTELTCSIANGSI